MKIANASARWTCGESLAMTAGVMTWLPAAGAARSRLSADLRLREAGAAPRLLRGLRPGEKAAAHRTRPGLRPLGAAAAPWPLPRLQPGGAVAGSAVRQALAAQQPAAA